MLPKELVLKMTLEEKAAVCSGKGVWDTLNIDRLEIPSITLTDGPHGLRKSKSKDSNNTIADSVVSTCFPTSSLIASSWDTTLLYRMGAAIAEEALSEGVAVVLGPGVNIKRSPLCGRNFEYYSEDPFLAGEIASSYIQGMQIRGVGASLKHFAANNQETKRLLLDVVVDERAMNEIYLLPFEMAVKKAKPWTVMASYNKINGTYSTENEELLTDILRKKWGYKGLVVSDWSAVNDIVSAIKAGLDLDMPTRYKFNTNKIIKAVKKGDLEIEVLDQTVERILELVSNYVKNKKEKSFYNKSIHHKIARKLASESIILLKNNSKILPLSKTVLRKKKLAVIGEYADKVRIQGDGSSLVNAFQTDNVLCSLDLNNINYSYARGYDSDDDKIDNALMQEATLLAEEADYAIVFAGLTNNYESEGFDRTNMDMPPNHNALIEAVSSVNKNVIVVLYGGSPMSMPWISKVKAILHTYLGGEAVGSAIVDILFGDVNPSGKTTESYPVSAEYNPSYNYFPGEDRTVEYRESIFVGYRFYQMLSDKNKKRRLIFPFGYGLSYTMFEYKKMALSDEKTTDKNLLSMQHILVKMEIQNTGDYDGSEVVELYISPQTPKVFRPKRELKCFSKVFLKKGESKTLDFRLTFRSFAYYNTSIHNWHIEEGFYIVELGTSSENILLSKTIYIENELKKLDKSLSENDASETAYQDINSMLSENGTFVIPKDDFEKILGRRLKGNSDKNQNGEKEKYSLNSTLDEIKDSAFGKIFYKYMMKKIEGVFSDPSMSKILKNMRYECPIRALLGYMGKGGGKNVETFINILNKKYLEALKTFFGIK